MLNRLFTFVIRLFFNNRRAVRIFAIWISPAVIIGLVSLFTPAVRPFCSGSVLLVVVAFGFAYLASRAPTVV